MPNNEGALESIFGKPDYAGSRPEGEFDFMPKKRLALLRSPEDIENDYYGRHLAALYQPNRPSALPSYEPERTTRLEPLQTTSWAKTLGEGALLGAGAGAFLSRVRPEVESAAYLATEHPFPASAREPFSSKEVAFASENPFVALSYANDYGDAGAGRVYPIRVEPKEVLEVPTEPARRPGRHAFNLESSLFGVKGDRPTGHREWPTGFSYKAEGLRPGQAKMVRGVIDPSPRYNPEIDPHRLYDLPSEQWAWGKGTEARVAGAGLSYKEVTELGHDAAKRAGIDMPRQASPVMPERAVPRSLPNLFGEKSSGYLVNEPWEVDYPVEGDYPSSSARQTPTERWNTEQRLIKDFSLTKKEARALGLYAADSPAGVAKAQGLDASQPAWTWARKELPPDVSFYEMDNKAGPAWKKPSLSDEDARKIIDEIANDPRFKGGEGKLVFRGLQGGSGAWRDRVLRAAAKFAKAAKTALTPAMIAKGVLEGAAVGAVSAGLGRVAGGEPGSAGFLTPPERLRLGGETSQERILEAVDKEEGRKEEWRAHLLDKAIEEFGEDGLRDMIEEDAELEDLRVEELVDILPYGPTRTEGRPPRLPIDVAEEALAKESVKATIREHKDVPFVKRILNPGDYLDSDSGLGYIDKGEDVSTVLLSTAGFDGREWVYPEIAYEGGRLVEKEPGDDEWAKRQVKAGNAIPFDSFEEADAFARGSWKELSPEDWSGLRAELTPGREREALDWRPEREDRRPAMSRARD